MENTEMKRVVFAFVVVAGLAAASCTNRGTVLRMSSSSPSPSVSLSASPTAVAFMADIPPGARRVAGGCGSTQAYRGPIPVWLEQADGHNTPTGLPYVVATPASAAGFIFGHPLRAGHPKQRSNKILWVVRTPREGEPLDIDVHPLGSSTPNIRESRPADSGPGEIYPDGIDVPRAGCWHFTLRWATGRAEFDLRYV
jgi:hypothetical protein